MDQELRALIRGEIAKPKAQALRDRLLEDPALLRRFGELLEEPASTLEPEPETHPGRDVRTAFRRIQERARARLFEARVEAVVDRLMLPLEPRPVLGVVGRSGEERRLFLRHVEERLRGRSVGVRWVHAGLNPFVVPVDPPVQCLLVEEGLLAPLIGDLQWVSGTATVLVGRPETWASRFAPLLLARTFSLPPAGAEEMLPAEPRGVREAPELLYACALGEWGVPAPVGLLARLSGRPEEAVRAVLDRAGYFQEIVSTGSPAAAPRDEHLLARLLDRDGGQERRRAVLREVVAAIRHEEAGTVVALLMALTLADRLALARELLQTVEPRLEELVGSGIARALAWARVLRTLSRPALAAAVVARALAAAPGHPYLVREHALTLADRGNLAAACAALEEVRRRNGDPELHRTLAELYTAQGKLSRAREHLEEALARDRRPGLLVALGEILAGDGRLEEADRHFAMALESMPGSAAILSRWAHTLVRQGRFQEAIERLNRAVGIEHWNVRHHLDLARVRVRAGGLEAAHAAVEKALLLEPEHPEALMVLGEIEAERAAWEAAEAAARAAARRSETPEAYQLLARIADLRGLVWEALEHLRSALRLGPVGRALADAWVALVERLGRAVELSLERAWLQPSGVEGAPGGVAAAGPSTGQSATWVAYEEGDTRFALTITVEGDVVGSVEVSRHPVQGAVVSLFEADPEGGAIERARGVTDEHGETVLGPADALQAFLSPATLGRVRVRVTLPPEAES